MDAFSLKVIVAGRTYPLTIKQEEETIIKAAAQYINTNIKQLQSNYAVKDMQDLLAMTSLQMAVKMETELQHESTRASASPDLSEDIKNLIERVDSTL